MTKGRAIDYMPEELAWVEAHKDWPRAQLHSAFCFYFDRQDVSQDSLKALCHRNGWMTGRTGRIEKGAVPHNKGKPMPYNANSAATRFKKGQRPANKQFVGYERIDRREGYVMLCVAEPNPWTGAPTHMVHKHRWLWERANGQVPEGHRLKCLDGDKTNTDPANWACIPKALAPRLNGRFGRGYDTAPAEIKPLILATAQLEHAAREARKSGRKNRGATK